MTNLLAQDPVLSEPYSLGRPRITGHDRCESKHFAGPLRSRDRAHQIGPGISGPPGAIFPRATTRPEDPLMLVNAAESRFRRGREALEEGRGLEALALFEAALELERRHGALRPQARYLSFYGLTLALEGGRIREGIGFCKRAIPEEFYNPELYWNYGRVLMAAGHKREAHEALRKGQMLAARPSRASPGISTGSAAAAGR